MRCPQPSEPSPDPVLSASYIYMVQHLIEQCLLFLMDREECVKALAKHAHVKPVVTTTVWNELEKANNEFFVAYQKNLASRQAKAPNNSSCNGNLWEDTISRFQAHNFEDLRSHRVSN